MAKGFFAGAFSRRRMRKRDDRGRGFAIGSLRSEARGERVLSEGVAYVDGHSGDHSWHYVMTPTRLIWGPRSWLPSDHPSETYPKDGFEYRRVERYRRLDNNVVEVVQPDRTTRISFIPSNPTGFQIDQLIQLVVRSLCENLTEKGARAS
jgi:hypothetical protein